MCLASFAQLACFMTIMTMFQYVFQVYFKNTDMIILGSVITSLPMVLLIPFVSKLTKRFGKKEMSVWPMIGAIVILLVMLFVDFPRNETGGWIYLALMGLANGCTGLFTLATWSFVADAVDYQEMQTGRARGGHGLCHLFFCAQGCAGGLPRA